MKPSLAFLSVITLAMCPLVSVTAAAPKRVLVVTLTTGFRHTSIPLAEALLVKLGETSGAYTVVDFARQPTTRVFPKPNKPGDLPATADEPAKARHAADLKNYDEALAKWSPDAQTRLDAEWRDALAKISPARLLSNKIDMVVFANTTGELAIPENRGSLA